MLTLLIKIFIKDYSATDSPTVRQAYGILCGAMGVAFNVILFAGKFTAGIISHSIAITADAFNNLSDAASSIITLAGFKLAGQKPDKDHPFGHGRFEYIAGLLVSVLIIYMALELLQSSIQKIIHPAELTFSPVVICILLLSILLKLYMAFYNHGISRKIDSPALNAIVTDSLSDALATSVVLISTFISHFSGFNIDGYCGVLLGLLVLYAGINAAKDTVSPLLGQAPEPEFVQKINDIVLSYENVIGIHDLIVHNYGPGRILISLHAEVPSDGDFLALHDMIDLIEHKLRDTLHCSAVIHMDPVCVNDSETNELKARVNGFLSAISSELTMHDFRIVKGPTHTNIIFDIVVPYRFHMTDKEIVDTITEKIRLENPHYFAVIEVDKKYS